MNRLKIFAVVTIGWWLLLMCYRAVTGAYLADIAFIFPPVAFLLFWGAVWLFWPSKGSPPASAAPPEPKSPHEAETPADMDDDDAWEDEGETLGLGLHDFLRQFNKFISVAGGRPIAADMLKTQMTTRGPVAVWSWNNSTLTILDNTMSDNISSIIYVIRLGPDLSRSKVVCQMLAVVVLVVAGYEGYDFTKPAGDAMTKRIVKRLGLCDGAVLDGLERDFVLKNAHFYSWHEKGWGLHLRVEVAGSPDDLPLVEIKRRREVEEGAS